MKHPQQGWSLIEALLVAVLLGGGWLGLQQLISRAHAHAVWLSRQTLAQGLADDSLECLRAMQTDCTTGDTPLRGAVYRQDIQRSDGQLQISVTWSGPGGASDKAQWSAVTYIGQVPLWVAAP